MYFSAISATPWANIPPEIGRTLGTLSGTTVAADIYHKHTPAPRCR